MLTTISLHFQSTPIIGKHELYLRGNVVGSCKAWNIIQMLDLLLFVEKENTFFILHLHGKVVHVDFNFEFA
jgi:hypothetical protein